MRRVLLLAGLLCLVAAGNVVGQTVNSQVGGIVQDPGRALVPGVTITLTNLNTGISSTQISNESGAYSFPSVQPGTYRLTATLPGFKTAVANELPVGTSTQVRWDFIMEIGELASQVEVSVSAQQLLTESSASIGEVLPEQRVRDLPLINGDILELVRIMPGLRPGLAGDANSLFAGLGIGTVNTVRDGLSVSDTRTNTQLSSTTTINPDLVGEIRIILTPVDAEQGRGNGQIQIQTRSGTNRFTGSAVWNVRNSALNANLWNNNRQIDPFTGQWSPTPQDWRNTHQYTVSYGGPIVRNKTFFFVLWDHNISNTRTLQTINVLTDTARQGIFRYFTGWNSGNARTPVPSSFPANATTGTYPVVDFAGNPVAPPVNTDGTPYTGGLRCYSLFGNVKANGTPFTAADCPGGTAIIGTAWDALRPGMDSTGYIQKLLDVMPRANYFAAGGNTIDGLNLAQFQWLRGRKGQNTANAQNGQSPELVNRKGINIKIDEHFNAKHRLSAGWSYQRDDNADNVANWPGGFNGDSKRRPHVLTVNFTSTLTSAIVNEGRFGIAYNRNELNPPWDSSDPEIRDGAKSFLLSGGTNSTSGATYPVAFTPGAGNFAFGNNVINTGSTLSGHRSPLYNFADTLSWTRGAHAFRMGAEVRLTRSNGYSGAVLPTASGGQGGNPSAVGNVLAALPSQLGTARTNAANLLYFLSGSVNAASMLYWIDSDEDVKNGTWQDYATAERRYRSQVANEYAVFWKDDWKIKRNLTLNIGLRYEYYGSPYLRGGYTASVVGQGYGLFGAGRTTEQPFDTWLSPGNLYLTGYGPNTTTTPTLSCVKGVAQSALLPVSTCDPDLLTRIEFVGPGSDKPDLSSIPKDGNNFGPAVGFAWNIPWFGEGKTSVRGGFQITFGTSGRNARAAENILGNVPGGSSVASLLTADFPQLVNTGRALTLADLPLIVPVRPTSPALPGGQVPIYNRNTAFTAYDPDFASPYAENFTLSVTRSLNRHMTLDLRYIGTIGKKREGLLNVNLPNVHYNRELFEALEMTRRGEDAPLFDQMFAGMDLHGATNQPCPNGVGNVTYGLVGTTVTSCGVSTLQRGSAHLRRNAMFTTNIAMGDYEGVATTLNTFNTVVPGLLSQAPGVSGRLLRNGCDRLAAGMTNISTRCFAENYIVANPQLSTATYNSNLGSSNYHGLQTQFSLRPVQGISFQTTYTWAKLRGLVPQGYTDPLDRDADYTYAYLNVKHDVHTNGTFELPIGPNKLFMGNSSGWVARLIERWNMSVITNWFSGNPRTIIGAPMRYAVGEQTLDRGQSRLNIVSPNFDNEMEGHAVWNGPNNDTGTYYGDKFMFVPDPQCQLTNKTDSMGFNLFTNGSCTLNGLAVRNPDGTAGEIMLLNPLPGGVGNMPLSLRSLGKWRFDMNIGKTFRLSESKSLQVRFDAINAMNHPDLSDSQPQTGQNINDDGVVFGRIPDKGGSLTGSQPRRLQGQVRFTF